MSTTSEDLLSRRLQIIDACIQQQRQIADVAKTEMDSAQQQSNEYGANVDRYDPFRTKMMRSRDMYARQYSHALDFLRMLNDIRNQPPHSIAEYGSVVITDHMNIFISIGAGKFMVGNTPFFAVSVQTPIFLAVKGSKVGDFFVVNGLTQTVKEIF